MMLVTPCMNFRGCCEEALRFYERAFGVTTTFLMRYAEADPRDWKTPLTEEQKNMIYHAEMLIGKQRIMCSDIIEFELSTGTSLSLTLTFDNAEQVRQAYAILQDGSTILYPMVSTTYSSCFVSLVDKFGMRWNLMTEQTQP